MEKGKGSVGRGHGAEEGKGGGDGEMRGVSGDRTEGPRKQFLAKN